MEVQEVETKVTFNTTEQRNITAGVVGGDDSTTS
jgi:hypothetical protein